MHNRIKDQFAAGKPAFGAQLRFGSPAIAELCGHSGFDFLVVDSEHAPQTPTGIQAQLQAIGNTRATPIVRLARASTRSRSACTSTWARWAFSLRSSTPLPKLQRALAPAAILRLAFAVLDRTGRAQYGLRTDEYFAEINDLVIFIALIETAEAVANIDEILAVEGVDTFRHRSGRSVHLAGGAF